MERDLAVVGNKDERIEDDEARGIDIWSGELKSLACAAVLGPISWIREGTVCLVVGNYAPAPRVLPQ